jgi:HK97 family phage portal protein
VAFYDKYLTKALDRLGVIRRRDLDNFLPPSAVFAGETWPGSEYNIYARWSEYELQRLAITNPWVYSAQDIISNEIAKGIIGVERRSKKEGEKWLPEIDHDFERIVEGRPNPYMSQFFTWKYQVMWLCLQGEAYWMNVPDKTGELRQLYPLPANRVVPVPDPSGERLFSYFAYSPVTGAAPQKLLPEQVCFHRFPHPFDYHRGMSPVSAYLTSLKIDTEARRFDLEDFQNGLTLKHLVSMRPETTERDRLGAQADLERGRKEGLRYMLIRAGQIDVKALEGRRGDNGDVRQLTREEADFIFGVPEGIRAANATEANATVAWNTFLNSTIWPLMCMLDEDMTAQIVHRFYGEDLRAKFEDVRPQNIELKLKEKDNRRKAQTYDEARAADGLEPHPDPDIGGAPYTVAGAVYLEKIRQGRKAAEQGSEGAEEQRAKAIKAGEETPDDVPDEVKEYEAELSRLIELASNGQIERTEFEQRVSDLTKAVLLVVFLLGSGKGEQELTPDDLAVLNERIATDLASVENLANDVYAEKFKPMDEGGAGWSVGGKVALWGTFAAGVYQLAKIFNPNDPYLEWRYGPTEHCQTCRALNGVVRRASEWRQTPYRPKTTEPGVLECGGWRCQCSWHQVKGPSRGELPVYAKSAEYEPVISGNGYAK